MVIQMEENKLILGENGRQKCSFCKKTIPKDIPRISSEFSTQMGTTGYKRICFRCILKWYYQIDSKTRTKIEEHIVEEKL